MSNSNTTFLQNVICKCILYTSTNLAINFIWCSGILKMNYVIDITRMLQEATLCVCDTQDMMINIFK